MERRLLGEEEGRAEGRGTSTAVLAGLWATPSTVERGTAKAEAAVRVRKARRMSCCIILKVCRLATGQAGAARKLQSTEIRKRRKRRVRSAAWRREKVQRVEREVCVRCSRGGKPEIAGGLDVEIARSTEGTPAVARQLVPPCLPYVPERRLDRMAEEGRRRRRRRRRGRTFTRAKLETQRELQERVGRVGRRKACSFSTEPTHGFGRKGCGRETGIGCRGPVLLGEGREGTPRRLVSWFGSTLQAARGGHLFRSAPRTPPLQAALLAPQPANGADAASSRPAPRAWCCPHWANARRAEGGGEVMRIAQQGGGRSSCLCGG